LAYNNAAGFLAAWNTAPLDQARDNLEQEAINCSPAQDVQFSATMKINLRLQATVGQLTNQVNQAQGQMAAANTIARQAQPAAQGAANVDRFRPAAPPSKYGHKKKGEHVGPWIPVIEDYLQTAPNEDYIRLASSYLEGGPKSLWTNVYEAYKRAHGGNEPDPTSLEKASMSLPLDQAAAPLVSGGDAAYGEGTTKALGEQGDLMSLMAAHVPPPLAKPVQIQQAGKKPPPWSTRPEQGQRFKLPQI
jgi:hypothetical protein